MRTPIKPILVAVLTAGLIAGFASSAPAAVADKSVKKFCEKALEVQTLLSGSAVGLTEENAGDYAADVEKGMKKLAKLAPTKKLRKALKIVAKYYGEVADSGDINSGEYGQEQIEALSTVTDYITTTCVPLLTTTTPPGG